MKRHIVLAALLSSILCAGALAEEPLPVVKLTPAKPAVVVKVTQPVVTQPATQLATQPAIQPVEPGALAKVTAAVTAASQPVVAEPKTVSEAVDTAKQGFEFAKTRNWFGLSAACIFIVMFVLNAVKLFDKIGKRWAYIILPILGIAAMLLARFAGGLSWEAAVTVLTSAPCTGLLWDFFKRGILGQEPTTPMKPV